ncbi:MAG: hypothetical protein ACRDX8_04395 [Acidimicrobiales bacterium]
MTHIRAWRPKYNSGSLDLLFAYAASVLWKGYGSRWSTEESTIYLGSYLATGPKGTQCRANTGGATVTADLPTPGFPITSVLRETPLGHNANGKRTIILVGEGASYDYASGIIIEQWCFSSPHSEAYLTADAKVAATSAASGPDNCVICVGGPAVAAIQERAPLLVGYPNFADWQVSDPVVRGFIDCNGADALESYRMGLAAAQVSAGAGWA